MQRALAQQAAQQGDIGALTDLQNAEKEMASERAYQQAMRPTKQQAYRLQAASIVLELLKVNAINITGQEKADDGLPTVGNFIKAVELLTEALLKN